MDPITLFEYDEITLKDISAPDKEVLTGAEKLGLKVQFNLDNSVQIRTGPNIGVIKLKSHLIVIKPKIVNLSNIFYILEYIWDQPIRSLNISASFSQQESILNLFFSYFLRQLELFTKNKELRKRIIRRKSKTSSFGGRIDFKKSHHQIFSPRPRICSSKPIVSIDCIENQIIKTTLGKLSLMDLHPNLKRQLEVQKTYFRDVNQLININKQMINSVYYDQNNQKYKYLHQLCNMILSNLSLSFKTGKSPYHCFILNMNILFELFIGKLFSQSLKTITIINQERGFIYGKTSNFKKRLTLRPDFLLKRFNETILVVEVKYKELWREGKLKLPHKDILQTLAYTMFWKCNGILVFPAGKIKIKDYFELEEFKFAITSVNLSGQTINDFRENISEFVEEVREKMLSLVEGSGTDV